MSHKIEAELEEDDDTDDENDKDNKSWESSDFKQTDNNQLRDTRKPNLMLIGHVEFVLFFSFWENLRKCYNEAGSGYHPPSTEKQKYGRVYACEEEKKTAAFEHSHEENCGSNEKLDYGKTKDPTWYPKNDDPVHETRGCEK